MATKVFNKETTGGSLYRDDNDSWTNVRNSATAEVVNVGIYAITANAANGNRILRRMMVGFDTSSLDALAKNLTTVSIRLVFSSSSGNVDSSVAHIVPCTWDAVSNIVVANYNDLTFSSLGSLPFASFSGTHDLAVSRTSDVNTTGLTEYYLISDRDLNTADPTGTNQIILSDAKLVVTYVPLAIPGSPMFFSGGSVFA